MDFGIQGFNPPFVPTLFMQIQKLMTLKLFLKICSFCPTAQEVIYLPWISETRKKYSSKYQVSGGRSLCQLQIPPIYKDQTTFTIHLYTFTIYKDQTTWLWGWGGSAGYMAGGWKISESILQSTMLKLRQRAWLMTIFVVVFLYLYVYTFVFSIFHSASFCAESRSNRLAGGVAWVFAFTICNFILAFPCIFISVCACICIFHIVECKVDQTGWLEGFLGPQFEESEV